MDEELRGVKLNPIGAAFALVGIRLLAKVLLQSGLLDKLDEVAAKSPNEADNLAIRILKAALEVAAT